MSERTYLICTGFAELPEDVGVQTRYLVEAIQNILKEDPRIRGVDYLEAVLEDSNIKKPICRETSTTLPTVTTTTFVYSPLPYMTSTGLCFNFVIMDNQPVTQERQRAIEAILTEHVLHAGKQLCNLAYQKKTDAEKQLLLAKNKELEEASITDSLTGLLNRRGWEPALIEQLDGARRRQSVIGLILGDIDDFRTVNKDHGHLAGDYVLKTIGGLLRRRARRIDTLGRYGGEEIIAVLPDTVLGEAEQVAECYRSIIESHPFSYDNKPLNVTMSWGVAATAHFPKKKNLSELAETLISKADLHLRAAKEAGKNRVVSFQTLSC